MKKLIPHSYSSFFSFIFSLQSKLGHYRTYFEPIKNILLNTPKDKITAWKPTLSGFLDVPKRIIIEGGSKKVSMTK